MRTLLLAGVVGLGCAVLAGCAEQRPPMSADDAMVLLRSGKPFLGCRDACLAAWREAQPKAQQLAAGGEWRDLAVLVARVGYQDDLTLYYLGRAADGLGYTMPAASYYRQSLQLSGTSIACARLSRQCGGVALPQDASLRLAALDRRVIRPRRGPAAPPPGAGLNPAAPASGTAPPSETLPQVETLPPVGSAAVPPAPPAPAAAAPADAADYIEPPPAGR